MKITKEFLASTIDETLLDPIASADDIKKLCERAKKYDFASVAILSCNVPIAREELKDSKVKVCAAIGFPLGTITPEAKAFEAEDAINNGADEIDMVMNVAALKNNDIEYLTRDISEVTRVVHKQNKVLKVILEISSLNREEAEIACRIAEKIGVDYVKSSTGFKGFSIRPTSPEDVKFMREHVGEKVKVKAAGGVRTIKEAIIMINAGADRLGTSSGAKIVEDFDEYRENGEV